MLPSTTPKEALLACPPSLFWSLLSFAVKSTLSSPCFYSDPLSCQVLVFAHLDFLPLTICCSGLTALFLFHLAKVALTYLPTALLVALRPLCPFQQAQHAQVFLSLRLSASSLMVSAAPTSLPLLFSFHVTLVLSSPPSFLLPQSLWQIWQKLSSPVLSRYNESLDTHFCWGTMRLMSWRVLLAILPSAILCSSLLISCIHFSQTGIALSCLNFLSHMLPQFPSRNLCSLIALAVFSVIYAAMNTAFF